MENFKKLSKAEMRNVMGGSFSCDDAQCSPFGCALNGTGPDCCPSQTCCVNLQVCVVLCEPASDECDI